MAKIKSKARHALDGTKPKSKRVTKITSAARHKLEGTKPKAKKKPPDRLKQKMDNLERKALGLKKKK